MQIPVSGLTCQSCANSITDAVSKLDGAKNVSVNFALKQLNYEGVEYDEVLRTLHALGYDSPVRSSLDSSTPPFQIPQIDKIAAEETHGALRRFVFAAIFGIPEFFIGMTLGMNSPALRPLEAVLTTAVVFGAGLNIHRRAWGQFLKGQLTMDTLVSMGSLAALLQSYIFWFRGTHHVGFETASTIIIFILLGRYLEARARRSTFNTTVELYKSLEQPVTRLGPQGEEWVVGLELHPGDRIRLRPGEICPVDGVIVEGGGHVDESSITGESLPQKRSVGEKILSGSSLVDSTLTILVKQVGTESFLGRLILELQKSQSKPVPLQRLADRVTAYFVPFVILAATAGALVQYLAYNNPEFGFSIFLSVLLIACPCALGLAIPTALVVGVGASARRGVLFRDPSVLELSAKIKDIYFDKTGTLTMGAPKISEISVTPGFSEKDLIYFAASLERNSIHPLARAILDIAFQRRILALPPVENFKAIHGRGVEGLVNGKEVRVIRSGQNRESRGQTSSDVFIDGKFAGGMTFADALRPEALSILKDLRDWGFHLHLLTGDHPEVIETLGVRSFFDTVHADLLPQDKEKIVREAREVRPQEIAFVGDGVNDVLALSAATVGFAVASGTPAALGAGGVSLARGIADLPVAFLLAQQTYRQLKFNLFWALAYNVIMMPGAFLGKISPVWASFAMAASSISVVLGSLLLGLRLRRIQFTESFPRLRYL